MLIKNISIFHNLGCPIVLGVSRKKFIKTNFTIDEDSDLDVGSIFYSLEGIRQGGANCKGPQRIYYDEMFEWF